MFDLNAFLVEHGYVKPAGMDLSHRLVVIFAILLLAVIIYFVLKKIVTPLLKKLVAKTSVTWDDHLLNDKVLAAGCYLIPSIVVYLFVPLAFGDRAFAMSLAEKVCLVTVIALCVKLVNAFISSFYYISTDSDNLRRRPLKGFYQMLKILVFCIGAILIVSVLIDKQPGILLTGLGASAAVLMLVFKDTIMGLVAGVQINAYDTLRTGDWIIMEKFDANGEIVEVSLNHVRVKNWDNSIVTIPSFQFISESFRNMREMRESHSRRISEKIYIDINSIRFCRDDEVVRFRKLANLKDDKEEHTNLYYFRFFMENYLRNLKDINPKPHLMLRQQPSTAMGVPIEIYCFTTLTLWIPYEHFKASVVEFAYASLSRFGLSAFQSPMGADLLRIGK